MGKKRKLYNENLNLKGCIKNLKKRVKQYEKSSAAQHKGIMHYKTKYETLHNSVINAVDILEVHVPPTALFMKRFNEKINDLTCND